MDKMTFRALLGGGDMMLFDRLWTGPDGQAVIWAGSSATGGLRRMVMDDNLTLTVQSESWLTDHVYRFSQLATADTASGEVLILPEAMSGRLTLLRPDQSGALSPPVEIRDNAGDPVALSVFAALPAEWSPGLLIGARASGPGLSLYRLEDGAERATLLDRAEETAKTTLEGVSDIVSLSVGSEQFIAVSSAAEDGLSSYAIGDGDTLNLRDTLGPKDGLWIDGLDDIAALTAGETQYIVGVSGQSGTLTSVRINPVGALFLEDIEYDDRNTRFAGAVALDVFSVADRSFVVTGGTDGGLSLFEVLPDGQLWHHQSVEQSANWDIGNILDISVAVTGDTLHIVLAGSHAGAIAQLVLPLSDLGMSMRGGPGDDTMTGTRLDDMLIGGDGNDALFGSGGEDTLMAGTGEDSLTGGGGADVFVFRADGQPDTIIDFQPGIDRIDLGDWGMVYDLSALTLTRQDWGATIAWRDELLHIHSADGDPIETDSWGADDILF
ncbi:MAG: hypothetical protein R8G60_09290 [Roseovarius pacificus]|nr:hypothetical protein [Roseovarius pacificus]